MDRLASIQSTLRARSRHRGFTLIELMVTIVIVAILASIAFPSYATFMRKSRRGDTESVMMDIAQREQQYLLDTRTYAPTVAVLNTTIPVAVSSYYNIVITVPGGAPPTFVVTATPKAGTAQAGDPTLTLNNTGAKTPTSVW